MNRLTFAPANAPVASRFHPSVLGRRVAEAHVRRCATNEALPTTTVFASSCQGSLVLGELVAFLLRLDVPSLEQWTWAAGVARTREYGQFHACRPGMLCRSGHHRYHCRSNN